MSSLSLFRCCRRGFGAPFLPRTPSQRTPLSAVISCQLISWFSQEQQHHFVGAGGDISLGPCLYCLGGFSYPGVCSLNTLWQSQCYAPLIWLWARQWEICCAGAPVYVRSLRLRWATYVPATLISRLIFKFEWTIKQHMTRSISRCCK